ncbi:hypothetical protein I3760_13G015200 [Carya illinoinensis]|nr:hypothetical protein I3760_13G015200 [Carya illinoinensis]
MEELGMEYFRNLLSRSFFQQPSMDKSRFVMHDLISDLAQSVAGDTCFRMEDRVCNGKQENILGKARHSAYLGGLYDGTKKFEVFSKFKHLRTFLPLMLPYPGYCYLTFHVPLQLLPKSRWLRVLSLNGYCITEISDKIGDLKHLWYLDLSYTPITSLPESITTLYNLQTLILEKCTYLKRLPLTFENLVNLRHLNILDAYSLEGMPPKICKLTCLRTLSNLIVGEGSCSGIKELGPSSNLRGTLCISRLENVMEPWDARDANLIGKPNLRGFSLEWSEDIDESRELEVLNMLQPHNNLKELTIECYGGIECPTWLGCPLFPNMVILIIENCEKCTSLPAIGQLPSLNVLSIGGMASVKNVGPEFCGDGSSQPFRSLETLHFKDMKEWENWIPCEEFPKLRELLLRGCPRLLGKLPNHLPLLNIVVIYGCGQLVVSISSFPELCELTIERWKGMMVCGGKVDFNSLYFESLSTISKFTGRIEGFNNDVLKTVENLTISDCEELTCLWPNDVGSLPHLPRLCVLKIDGCPKLVSLVANEVEEQLQQGIPSTLREIEIYNCKALESLPKTMMYHYRCLEYIYLNGCDILTCFAKGQLPPTLKQLKKDNCKNMQILLEDNDNNNCSSSTSLLENLDIWGCPSLESLISSGVLPATLKQLLVYNCPKLQSIAKGLHHCLFLECIVILNCENLKSLPTGIQNLSHLDRIDISSCPALDFFTDGELLPANLRVLKISNNKKMQAVPNCIHKLGSLQELEILKCPVVSFPKEGFPTNLTSLKISHLNITQGLFEWGLHKLTSLELLQICGGCSHLVSFPNMKLPATLRRLNISHFLNLEYLSSEGLRNLISLEELERGQCEKLTSFPENGLPPSLLKLCIVKCEKFMSFPKNGLPPSLLELYISKCPLLEECCKKDQGSVWLKIAHIPYVQFDSDYL